MINCIDVPRMSFKAATQLNEETAELSAALLSVMASPIRLALLMLLAGRELPANAIALRLGISFSSVSQHLAKLRMQRLVTIRKERQTVSIIPASRRPQPRSCARWTKSSSTSSIDHTSRARRIPLCSNNRRDCEPVISGYPARPRLHGKSPFGASPSSLFFCHILSCLRRAGTKMPGSPFMLI